MPKITNINSRIIPLTSSIAPSSAGIAGSQQAASTVEQTGNSMVQQQQQFAQQAASAADAAEYNRAYTKAVQQYQNRVDAERANNQAQENQPIPSLDEIMGRVKSIKTQIAEEQSSLMRSPAARDKFNRDFNIHASQREILTTGEIRGEQLQAASAQIGVSVQELTTSAIGDSPTLSSGYIADVNNVLSEGVANGVISAGAAEGMREDATNKITVEHVRGAVEQDPEAILSDMEAGETFGLPEDLAKQVKDEARLALDDQNIKAIEEVQESARLKSLKNDLMKTEMVAGIWTDEVDKYDIVTNDALDEETKKGLLKLQSRVKKQYTARGLTYNNIELSLQSGQSLDQFTPGEVGDYFKKNVKTIERQQGQDMPLSEKAILASRYNTRVKPLNMEIENSVTQGSSEQKLEAVKSFNYLNKNSPNVLEGLDKKSVAFSTTAIMLMNNTGMSEQKAIEIAQQSVLEVDKDVRAEYAVSMKAEEALKPKSINETVNEVLDNELGFFSDMFSDAPELAPGIQNRVAGVIKEGYMLTGDIDKAKAFASHHVKQVMGPTEFNDGQVMLWPPEKAFPGADPDDLKSILSNDLDSLGLKEEDVIIESNSMTRQLPGQASYTISERVELEDGTSVFMPVRTDDGDLAYFVLDNNTVGSFHQAKQAAQLEEVKQRDKELRASGDLEEIMDFQNTQDFRANKAIRGQVERIKKVR